jgi:glycyl-tRNA synthetase beta chain
VSARNLLVELLVEELPPKALKTLGEAFATTLADGLRAEGLASEHSVVTPFATPRRLAAHVSAVQPFAADRAQSHRLMPVSVGLDADGRPTPALLKKLASVGADASALPQLQRRADAKGEALFLERAIRGATLAEGLQRALVAALQQLPIPKLMQYQLADGWSSVAFVRPVHRLVALHGADVVPVSALGLEAGRQTEGHRFEAVLSPVMLGDADHYARQLEEQGAVIAGFAARRGEISRQLHAAAARAGLTPLDDPALLDEVTALVERPNVLLCEFEPEFLAVPQECLILTMKANQKYFPLLDASARLTNKFLVVSNIRPADPARVIEGNERVVRPRLADARFFFDQDRKRTLESRVAGLDQVVYHHQLGSLGERVRRLRAIAHAIGTELGGEVLARNADRAALLAKADLLTDMVGEFPELQGVMGAYYARHDGASEEVACAVEDHYRPRFAGDTLPRHATGLVVALADKLETLVGLFGIGQLPSGDRDPFALRRHALGVLRILIERELPLALDRLITIAFDAFPAGRLADARAALETFVFERLGGAMREQGYTAAQTDAVLSMRPMQIHLVPRKLEAVRRFATMPQAESLAAANKRVGNILKKSAPEAAAEVDAGHLVEPAEAALHQALLDVAPQSQAAMAAGDYTASLQALAALKTPVDAFFDAVLVNADDPRLRANRLGLLTLLHTAMNRVADLSKLAV